MYRNQLDAIITIYVELILEINKLLLLHLVDFSTLLYQQS